MRYLANILTRHQGQLIIMSFLLLSACGGNAPQANRQTTVPQVFINSLNTGKNGLVDATSMNITTLHTSDGKVGWQHQAQWLTPGFHSMGAPVVVDGVLYTPSDSFDPKGISQPSHPLTGFLSAFRTDNGQRLWQVKVGAIGSPPIVHNGIVYLSAIEYASPNKKWIYAFHTRDGKQLWRTEITGDSGANDTFTFANGNLYISSNQICFDRCSATYLFSLNATTGTLRWRKTFQATSSSAITVSKIDQDAVYVYIVDDSSGAPQNGLYALNASNGEQLWSVAHAVPLIGLFYNAEWIRGATIQIIAGVIYAKTTVVANLSPDLSTYAMTALDAHSGHILWSIPTTVYGTILAVDAHMLYVQTEKANWDLTKPAPADTPKMASPYTYFLSAIAMQNGHSLWQRKLASTFNQSQVVDGILYSQARANSTQRSSLMAINTTNGTTIWQTTLTISSNDEAFLDPVFTTAQNVLYTVVNNDTLTAINLKDGKMLWQTKTAQTAIVAISIA